MRARFVAIFALLLAVLGFNMGLSLQGTLLGLRGGIERFDLAILGIVMSAYFVGFVAGSILGPNIVNRVGHIRAFAALAALGSAAVVLHALFVAPVPWILFRAITGFCFSGMCMVIESWLNQRAASTDRSTILSFYMGTTFSAAAGGQLLLNIWPPSGFEPFVFASILMTLCLVPVALTTSPAPPLTRSRPMPLSALFRASPVGVVGCFSTGLLFSAVGGLGAVFAQSIGMSTFEISIFMMLIVVGGTASLWPLGRLSDRLDRRIVVAGSFFAAAGTAAAVIFAASMDDAQPLLFAMAVLYGASAMPIYGITVAHANDKLADDQYVPASSTLLLCYGLGAALGPVSASFMMASLGPTGLFGFVIIVGLTAGSFVVLRIVRRAPTIPEVKGAFVPTPIKTPGGLILTGMTTGDTPAEQPETA